MEVRVNVINEMKKLRNSTYSDRLSWVDELVQNCQRSKATHIKVTVERDKVIVEDNGVGCTDPQVLFDKSSSGWDSETQTSQNPFGEGFFSTLMVADNIKVSSIGFDAIFDVQKMFEQETTECIQVRKTTRKSGFVVVLTELRDFYQWEVIRRFEKVGKYIKSPTMSVNGNRVKYEGLNPTSGNKFVRKVSNPWFKGWLQPFKWGRDGYSDDELKTFAFSRYVTELPAYGISGVLNLVDGVVDLRSPDRRDFIHNDAYYRFTDAVEDEVKKMFLNLIKTGSDKDIDDYADLASRHLKVEDYKNLIRLRCLESAPQEEEEQEEYCDSDIMEVGEVLVSAKADITYQTPICSQSCQEVSTDGRTGSVADDIGYAFYVLQSEVGTESDAIQLARLYRVPVVVIRNVLEENVVEQDDKFRHIREFSDLVSLRVDFKNIEPQNESEVRAYKILAQIAYSITGNTELFSIADLDCSRILSLGNREEEIEKVETFAVAHGKEIFINRKHMAGYEDLKDDDRELSKEDMKFILLNIDTIAHEMSHALYGTVDNTKEHFEQTGILVQRIINALYGGR